MQGLSRRQNCQVYVRQRAAGRNADEDGIVLAAELSEQFGRGAMFVRAGVRWVGPLVGPHVGGRGGAEVADSFDRRKQVAAGGVKPVDEFEPGAALSEAADALAYRLRIDDVDEAAAAAAGKRPALPQEVRARRDDVDAVARERSNGASAAPPAGQRSRPTTNASGRRSAR
jgi:hypothetical protein